MSTPNNKSKWSKTGSSYKKQQQLPPAAMAATSSDDDDYMDEVQGLMVHDDMLDERVQQQLVKAKAAQERPVGFLDRMAQNVTEVYNSTLGAELYGSAPILAPGSKTIKKHGKKDAGGKAKTAAQPSSPKQQQRNGGSPNPKKKKLVVGSNNTNNVGAVPASPGKKKKTVVIKSKQNADTAEQTAQEMAAAMNYWDHRPTSGSIATANATQQYGSQMASQQALQMEQQLRELTQQQRAYMDTMTDDASIMTSGTGNNSLLSFQPAQSIDIMKLLKQNAKNTAANSRPSYMGGSGNNNPMTNMMTDEVQEQTQKMTDVMKWWKTNTVQMQDDSDDPTTASALELQEVVQWWYENQIRTKHGKGHVDNYEASKACHMHDFMTQYQNQHGGAVRNVTQISKDMIASLEWWDQNHHKWDQDSSYDSNFRNQMHQLSKMNGMVDFLSLSPHNKKLLGMPTFHLQGGDMNQIQTMTKELEATLKDYVLYDQSGFVLDDDLNFQLLDHLSLIDRNKMILQHTMVQQWNMNHSHDPKYGSKDLEDIIAWWDTHGMHFSGENDPNLSFDDQCMYKKFQSMIGNWTKKSTMPDAEEWNVIKKELRESILFWNRNFNVSDDDMSPYEMEKIRLMKQIHVDVNRYVTNAQAKKMMKDVKDNIGWWRTKGPKFNKDTAAPDDLARYHSVEQMYKNWDGICGTLSKDMTKKMGETISWWIRHQKGRGLDESAYTGTDLDKFRMVQQSLQQWQLKNANQTTSFIPDMAMIDGKEIMAALEHWNTIKHLDESQFNKQDEFVCNRLQDVVRQFTDKKMNQEDLMFFMRNPKTIQMLLDTVTDWKKFGCKMNLRDMPMITAPEQRTAMKQLFADRKSVV